MTNGRLNIGLFICHLDNDYAYDLCKGIDYAVKELDANLFIFPGMYINAAYNDPTKARYDYQYNSVFYYASPANLDVLIVSIGTIGTFLSESDIQSFLDNFKEIPILTLEIEVPGYNHLYVESQSGLKQAIEHLIHVHGKKRIGFVSGRASNADAVERLNIYKSTLEANGLHPEENLIVHGNFSEYCEDIVGELLDNNPDIDAVVFANDQMALGGYNEFKRRGIEVGKDLAVTGYDDSPVSLALSPTLTTVRSSIPDLGYHAVHEAINVLKNGSTNKSVLNSSLIIRKSCGCKFCCDKKLTANQDFVKQPNATEELLKEYVNLLLGDFKESFIQNSLYQYINPMIKRILEITLDDTMTEYPIGELLEIQNTFLMSDATQYYTFDNYGLFLDNLAALTMDLIHEPTKTAAFFKMMNSLYSALNTRNSSLRYSAKKDYQLQIWNSSYIARDTLDYGKDDNTCFSSIIERLHCLSFDSSYVYLYDDPVMILGDGSWRVPDKLILQAYDNDTKSAVLDDEYIKSTDIFDNAYTPKNRRCTYIINPIFTNEQQHGVFVCEIDITKFHHIYAADLQLGTAFKFLNLIKEQMATQKQLMLSLQEIHSKNNLLNQISVSDELTGLYNRRGFMDLVAKTIADDANDQKRAMLVFADMDSLKLVNDKFGHSDGDFALKSIADNLKKSFRDTDIIGRIGGDEFVAFALLDQEGFIEQLQESLKQNFAELNDTCGKPYYIDISIGIAEFICSKDTSIKDVMSEADTALYSNKRYKRISVLKD